MMEERKNLRLAVVNAEDRLGHCQRSSLLDNVTEAPWVELNACRLGDIGVLLAL